MRFFVNSEKEMTAYGEKLGAALVGGEVIALCGEMGAGKTILTKGIARALGVTEPVLSPTFTIMNEYEGRLKLYHYDAYRLICADEAYETGLADYLGSEGSVSVVEWPQNIEQCFEGLKVLYIEIKYAGENVREIIINDK